jgi:2-polyprenyl-3-methyl-5-hydroxy-6-metoxy-1,4-benzoquinol methylase
MKADSPYCTICNTNQTATIVKSVRETPHALRQCKRCGVRFLHPQPTWEEIKGIYTASYYKAWGMEEQESASVALMKKLTFTRMIRAIKRRVARGALLDVGTASGFLLEVAQNSGFEPFGVELSEYAGGLAAKKFGAEHIHIGTLESAPFPKESFSVITMSDLIEHVQDPVQTLHMARGLLKSDGLLVIMTPNTASLTARLMGVDWVHYKLEHLFYWNPSALGVLAKQTGFRIVDRQRAVKALTLEYFRSQFAVYNNSLLTPLSRIAAAFPFRSTPFYVSIGEMLVFLHKA